MSNIRDHMRSLTPNTSQLLQCFQFDKNSDVLQIGSCDVGLIKYLGKHFQSVVCLEQDRNLVSMACACAKKMENVSVVCAPFQGGTFRKTFDIIFCIGSTECYCNNLGMDVDSLRKTIMSASELLKHDGVFILALHIKPLGYRSIKELLAQHFREIRYYYPFPDYREPIRILSEELLGKARLEELVADFLPRENKQQDKTMSMADNSHVRDLSRIAETLLVVAGKQSARSVKADWLGIMYANQRIPSLQTVTKIYEDERGVLRVNKTPRYSKGPVRMAKLTLHPLDSPWIDGISLHQQMLMNCSEQSLTLKEIFSPCQIWIDTIRNLCISEGEDLWIDGRYIDNIWKNCIVVDSQCQFFDYEWEWHTSIPFRPFLIRALMYLFSDVKLLDTPAPSLSFKPIWRLCVDAAGIFGITLRMRDFAAFIRLESELQKCVTNTPQIKTNISLLRFLISTISASKLP